jgi:hypothetical protein
VTSPLPPGPLSALPAYQDWQATCDTLHGHTQILGKLSAALAPPEPGFQHLALRLTARGWETRPLPCPDGSGVIVVALDLQLHEAVVEHSRGRIERIPLTPDRSVGEVTRAVMSAVRTLAGDDVAIDMAPKEVPWSVPLDDDDEHARYDTVDVTSYFAAATDAAIVLGVFRWTHAGRATQINAWWGSFDIAVSIDVDAAEPDGTAISREITVGWWPGDATHGQPAFYAYASPAPDGIAQAVLAPDAARWDGDLGEFLLEYISPVGRPITAGDALAFAASIRDAAA